MEVIMKSLKITLDVIPSPKQRPRTVSKDGKSWTYTPQQTVEAEEAICWLMAASGYRDYFEAHVPLSLSATFYLKEPAKAKYDYPVSERSGDLDNYTKLVLDSLNELVFPDDSQICELHLRKVYDTKPRIELEIRELQER